MANRTVFLSSTRKDLLPYVDAVDAALRAQPELELTPARNEYWGARPEAPAVVSQVEVGDADLFVGIYGWRYGYVPEGAATSITEQELEMAVEREKPIFCYLVEDSVPPPADLPQESEKSLHMLAELKARVQEDFVVARFTEPRDLAQRVVKNLSDRLALEALLAEKRGLLRRLWKTVHSSWIEGVLRPAVPAGRWIAIGREERPEAVGKPAPPRHRKAAVELPIRNLFQRANGKLLVLGRSAGGKTIELLELANEQGKLAWSSHVAPIPVVFQLGSWHKGVALEDWMGDQLVKHFGAGSEEVAKAWLPSILPLLDALDEVPDDYREDCVAAIEDYLERCGQETGMVVCCQAQVYEEEFSRLGGLRSAVALLPLTPEQVDKHLAAGGPELAGVRAAVAGSVELRRLAESPLLLHRLEEIYRGRPAEEIQARNQQDLAEKWIVHALEPTLPWIADRRRGRERPPWRRHRPTPKSSADLPQPTYSPAAARRVLTWLARNMTLYHQPLFQIERLQPSWFGSRGLVWAYALLSRAAGGALLALPLMWLFREAGLAAGLLVFGLLGGAVAGAIDAVALARHPRRVALKARRRRYGRAAVRALLVAVGAGLVVQLFGPLWLRLVPSSADAGADAENLRLATVLLAALAGGVFGARSVARDRSRDIRIGARLQWRRWSWRGVRLGAVWGGLSGAALAAIGWLNPTISHLTPALWLLVPPAFAVAGALGGGALGALGVKPLERQVWANKGTWLTLPNAGLVALCTTLAAAIVITSFLGIFAVDATPGLRWRDLWIALSAALALGFWAGLGFSGLDFLQHFLLRGLLGLSGSVPARFVGFLDYATDRGLLKRSGSSYEFYDLFLRRYLAESPKR